MLDRHQSRPCVGAGGHNTVLSGNFQERLVDLHDKYPNQIRGPFGEGMMVAMTIGDGSLDVAKRTMMRMFDCGLLGFISGGGPTRIRFLPPPAITTNEHIDHAISILDSVLSQ